MPPLLQWIQDTWISTLIRESTWGYPIVGAIHVLGMAWFGGLILVDGQRAWKRTALAFMLASGIIVFASQPVRYYESVSFRIKMAAIVLAGVNAWLLPKSKFSTPLMWILWIVIIFASRGIAFF
jgi:hypothetical protein